MSILNMWIKIWIRKFFLSGFTLTIIFMIYWRFYNSSTFMVSMMNIKSIINFNIFENDFIFDDNQTNNSFCFIPKLLVDDPTLRHLMKKHKPLICSSIKNWIYTEDGKFYIDSKAVENQHSVNCTYYHIKRISEREYDLIKYANFLNGSSVLGDGFKVMCEGTEATYTNVHFTVPDLKRSGKLPKFDAPSSILSDTHIFFFLLDSMSRINFIRKLPKFYNLLTEEMNALDMESFNVVGDGTPWAVIPLTTGHFQYELPEGRKRLKNATFLDDWPFIFKDYKKAGYGTVYAEEQPAFNAYTYKLKGFDKVPVDHYLRHILLVADEEKKNHKPYCLGDTPKSLVWFSYWRELKKMYEKYNRRTLSFLFSSETSHDDYNLVQSLDEHLVKTFKSLIQDNLLNNTILIVMADHGRRFGPVRQSQSGKIEEKLPFLAVIPPPWFSKSFPNSNSNLMKNRNRLMTVFDLHETLKHMLNFTDEGGLGDLKNRGISLFKEIPHQRTCQDAHIKPHFCACLDWKTISDPSWNRNVQKGVDFVLNEINKWLQVAKDFCSILSLQNITSAQIFKPNDDLLAFKESSDYDNYFPDLSANKKLSSILYQIRFTTMPGNADWEVTVTYVMDSKQFTFVEDNLSRLNMYGDQPKCIIDTFHNLRSYCYCLSPV